jgi:DNA invertase Pin-like site-specific DNA recombinase
MSEKQASTSRIEPVSDVFNRNRSMKKAAIYTRSSTSDRRRCDRQRDDLIAKFGDNHEIVGEYRDDGKSGQEDGPAPKKLIADSREGEFAVLLCADVTRLGRMSVFEAMQTLQEHGVRVVTLRDGEIDDVARRLPLEG